MGVSAGDFVISYTEFEKEENREERGLCMYAGLKLILIVHQFHQIAAVLVPWYHHIVCMRVCVYIIRMNSEHPCQISSVLGIGSHVSHKWVFVVVWVSVKLKFQNCNNT